MKPACIFGPPCFELMLLSESLREVMSGLVSDNARPWLVRDIDPRGLGFRDRDVTYGDSLPSVGTGERPPGGDGRP